MNKYFNHPIDASGRVAGFGLASGFVLLGINYQGGTERGYTLKLIRPDLTEGTEVIGVYEDSPAEVASELHIKKWLTEL